MLATCSFWTWPNHMAIRSRMYGTKTLAAAHAFKDFEADLVLGVGGGSVLDVAKLVRLTATHPEPLAQYDDAIGGSARIVAKYSFI